MADLVDSLSEQQISDKLRDHVRDIQSCDGEGKYREAAVLIPLIQKQNGWHVLFTRRTDSVQDHKGQVSFPGGGFEPQDVDPPATAMRETFEEIGLPQTNLHVLGLLECYKTVTNYVIWPVVARIIHWPCEFRISKDEVDRVFTIPLAWLADDSNLEIRPRILRDGRLEDVVYYQEYEGELVWGVTGRIMLNFLQTLNDTKVK